MNISKILILAASVASLTACGNLVNKQNSSPTDKAPSKAIVQVPPDDSDDPSPTPTPEPSPSPTPTKKPCHRWMQQDGQFYEEQEDGQWATFEVPPFESADEEADFWHKKGGGCQKPPTTTPTPPPLPTPPVSTVKPSMYCKPDASGNFNFDTIMTGGNASDPSVGGYVFGQGGGCVNRPLREVWAVAMNQALMVWDGTSGTGYGLASPAGVTKAFDVHYSVTRRYLGLPFTVTWEMDWYHTVEKGTPQDPEKILINYHRYHGTTHIGYWEGSIVLQKVTDQITGVYIRNQINADSTGVDGATSGASQIVDKYRKGHPDMTQLP